MSNVRKEKFGVVPNSNEEVSQFTVRNQNGYEAKFLDYGARWVGLLMPDKLGTFEDVVLGFDDMDGYLSNDGYSFGAMVGRWGGRISPPKFSIDGKEYILEENNPPAGGRKYGASLHGGYDGYHKRLWNSTIVDNGVNFELISEHMDAGYPGKLKINVIYTLSDANEVIIDVKACLVDEGKGDSASATVLNIINHAYFNLGGLSENTICSHKISIPSKTVALLSDDLHFGIPSGLGSVEEDKINDLRELGFHLTEELLKDKSRIKSNGGIDLDWILNKTRQNDKLVLAATLVHPSSSRQMEVFTDHPAIHLYTGNFLSSGVVGKGGKIYDKYAALCLEAQNLPNAPNMPDFPNPILRLGEVYHNKTVHKFSVAVME